MKCFRLVIVIGGLVVWGSLFSCSSASKAPPSAGTAETASPRHALHNVHRVNDRIVSGSVPEGGPGFDDLRDMGIRTVISVDGATPDIEAAQARGMRYVHIPVTYANVTNAQRLEIARAIRDLPGPVYVHCHHGKHRGPAAAAAAAVALGIMTPDEGIAFMKAAGTASNYQGLYACVSTAVVASAAEIDSAPADFPQVRRAHGLVAAMVEVDQAYELLGEIRAAEWQVPKTHPDLVPAAEAGRLTDNLRIGGEDPKCRDLGDDFVKRLAAAVEEASALEEGIVAGEPPESLDAKWKIVAASCKDCHATYRDRR
ncbi:MAG: cytochrome c [Phycisphaeraceae bacterium]|nr:cytochrome c [Phycisphaeraceae bacterium]